MTLPTPAAGDVWGAQLNAHIEALGGFGSAGAHPSGAWLTFPNGSQASSGTLTQDILCGLPIIVGRACTIAALGLRVTTLAAASAIRLGVYDNGNGGLPKTLLLDAGTVVGTSTGDKIVTGLSLALLPGVYWLCGVAQGGAPATGVGPSNSVAAPYGFHVGDAGSAQFNFQGTVTRHNAAVAGALPATFVPDLANNTSTNSTPRLFARVA